jgi:polyisoprenoid-binding protein YceI
MTATEELLSAPPEGTYAIDPARSSVTVLTRLGGVIRAPGTFTVLSGTIEVTGPAAVAVHVVLDAASFKTKSAARDRHSTSAEFLDAGRYPKITYAAAAASPGAPGASVDGFLTVREITAPVPLAIQSAELLDGELLLTALATVDRYAFGVTRGKGLVARQLPVTIKVAARRTNSGSTAVVNYDSHSIDQYARRWVFPMGPGEPEASRTRRVAGDGTVSIAAVPFTTGVDAVFDHAKYFAVSRDSFPMPRNGSLQFSADIAAATPGTEPGRVIHGTYTGAPDGARPYAQPTLEGQQAAVMLNMSNTETGQLFDWFVSGSSVFALIERLPSNVANPALPASDPEYVGLNRAYTQIVKSGPAGPGETHNYAIRYTRDAAQSSVEYLLDGELFARVDHVGIPLDTQGTAYTGTYPSYHSAPGEELKDRMDTFTIGHGLYNVLDAFPFQHPAAPELAVSVPITERLFGQGAQGRFTNFEVTTASD